MTYGRTLLLAALTALAFLSFQQPASAAISVLPVTTTATSGSVTLRDTTAGIAFTCAASSLTDTIAADGSSTIRPVSYSGCTGPGGAARVIQNANWVNRITLLLNASGQIIGAQTQITIPLGAATIEAAGGLCRFDFSGTITTLNTGSGTTPPALALIRALNFNGAGLTILNVQGLCGLVGTSPNNAMSYAANYSLSPTISITLR